MQATTMGKINGDTRILFRLYPNPKTQTLNPKTLNPKNLKP